MAHWSAKTSGYSTPARIDDDDDTNKQRSKKDWVQILPLSDEMIFPTLKMEK
jgi:hypothetical protein